MNVLQALKEILVFALKGLYWFFNLLNVSFLGWEIFPGFRLYYIIGALVAFVIGKKLLRKILLSPFEVVLFFGNILLEFLRIVIFKFLPAIWHFLMVIIRRISSSSGTLTLENFKDKIEDVWWKHRL